LWICNHNNFFILKIETSQRQQSELSGECGFVYEYFKNVKKIIIDKQIYKFNKSRFLQNGLALGHKKRKNLQALVGLDHCFRKIKDST